MSINKGNALKNKILLIMKKDDVERIRVSDDGNEIIVDLHSLGTREAMILINNIINLNRDECNIKIIHGYNHGTAIKDMINNRFVNKRIVDRKGLSNNPGVTTLVCKGAVC